MTVDLIWPPQLVYSIPENKAILIGKYFELSFQQVFICMIRSLGKKSAAVLISEVLPAITNSEMIFKISLSLLRATTEDSIEEFHKASDGEGRIDLPFP
jgi:hypothetical protein